MDTNVQMTMTVTYRHHVSEGNAYATLDMREMVAFALM